MNDGICESGILNKLTNLHSFKQRQARDVCSGLARSLTDTDRHGKGHGTVNARARASGLREEPSKLSPCMSPDGRARGNDLVSWRRGEFPDEALGIGPTGGGRVPVSYFF